MYYDSVRIETDNNSYLIAGVTSLGIMPVRVRFGATPTTGSLSAYHKLIRTHIRAGNRPFVLV